MAEEAEKLAEEAEEKADDEAWNELKEELWNKDEAKEESACLAVTSIQKNTLCSCFDVKFNTKPT